MRVALVHEFLTQLGGAERVLQCFHELFPDAPVYTLVYDEAATGGFFRNWDIRASFLQKLPGGVKHYKWYLPLMSRAVEAFDFSGFDLVISDSSAFAKGIVAKKPTAHICYCHTPTRYLWQDMDEYTNSLPHNAFVKTAAKIYLRYYLKDWDYRAAQRPDRLLANSRTVQRRIYEYYGRAADVVYPPVDTGFFKPSPPAPLPQAGEGGRRPGEGYYLTASRLEPYKKIGLVTRAFNHLGLALKVAGSGSDALKLKAMAGPNIEFLGKVSDEHLRDLYRGARAFVFPALEDAGIMILESLACGIPVIGLAGGGTAEFIRDGENGALFKNQTARDIASAVRRFENMKFDGAKLRDSVMQYDKTAFKAKTMEFVRNLTRPPATLSDIGEGRER